MSALLELGAVVALLLVLGAVAWLVVRVRQLLRWRDAHVMRHDVLQRLNPKRSQPPEPWKRERARTNADPLTSRRSGLR